MVRVGSAKWLGKYPAGQGQFILDAEPQEAKNAFTVEYDHSLGSNPEAMLGAAQSGCYSLVLSMILSKAGYDVEEVDTHAEVAVGNGPDGYGILGIKLITKASVEGIDDSEFQTYAVDAKNTCFVCKALAAVDIELEAHLMGKSG